MSKRSRRERREHQQQRAVATGDVAALRQLADKSPGGAVAPLVKALASPPADPAQAAELDTLAASLAATLRRAGEPATALTLAAAGQRRTATLRLEEAAAAFACGRDEIAAAVAAVDEAVAVALGPLLQAARGEVVEPSPVGPELRALHTVARAAAHARRGEPDKAHGIVKRMPTSGRAEVLAEEILAAAELHDPERAAEAAALLDGSERLPRDGEIRHLLAGEVPVDEARLAQLPLRLAADPVVRRRAARAAGEASDTVAAVLALVRALGPDAFADRGGAHLYQGFALCDSDPAAAIRSFERAAYFGADPIEALRGKALAAHRLAHEIADAGPEGIRAMRDAASAADKLAQALARAKDGGPLAAAAGATAARAWLDTGDVRAARAAIERARPHAGGAIVDRLDLVEADAVGFEDVKEAERRVDAVIARSPANHEAWELKASLALSQGDEARRDEILLEAAAATKDPELLARARDVRAARGELTPFEGMVPGQASAGALARELCRTTTDTVDPLVLAAPHREALAPRARLAFDVAAMVIAGEEREDDTAVHRLRDALLAWKDDPHDVARILCAAITAGLTGQVPRAAAAFDAATSRRIAEVLIELGAGKTALLLLPRFAADLSREELAWFSRTGQKGRRGPPRFDPETAGREIDEALAPDFSVLRYLMGLGEPQDEEPAELSTAVAVSEIARELGIPERPLEALPPTEQERLLDLIRVGPTPATVRELELILGKVGVRWSPPGSKP